MRVNVYAEEMTQRVEIIAKTIDGVAFTGLRLYLELPATVNGEQYQGPFMHRPGDDDSSAVTFWGKRDLRDVVALMRAKLDEHYDGALSSAQRSQMPRLDDGVPTHKCKECGALWRFNRMSETGFDSDTWSLKSPACGKCCDNVIMGSQIVPVTMIDLMHAYNLFVFDRVRAGLTDQAAETAAHNNEQRADAIEEKARAVVVAYGHGDVRDLADIEPFVTALIEALDVRKA